MMPLVTSEGAVQNPSGQLKGMQTTPMVPLSRLKKVFKASLTPLVAISNMFWLHNKNMLNFCFETEFLFVIYVV